VNKQEVVNIEGAFETEAVRILRQIPGLTVVPHGTTRPDHGAEAVLRFAETSANVAVEFKQRANAATAWQIVHYAHMRLAVAFKHYLPLILK